MERVIEVIVLLNKPLNCTSVSLPLFPRELDTLHMYVYLCTCIYVFVIYNVPSGDSAVLFTGAMPDEYHPPFSIHPLVPIMV